MGRPCSNSPKEAQWNQASFRLGSLNGAEVKTLSRTVKYCFRPFTQLAAFLLKNEAKRIVSPRQKIMKE
jgi:hypothetical protein